MPQKTVIIKKYENRRLYDATNSRYVNLEDVAQILKDGDDVRVVDAATGNDITRLILTQIIVEDAKTPNSAFPLDLLRQMIISSGRVSQETALRYMKTMLDIYQDSYRAISPAMNPFSFFRQEVPVTPSPVPSNGGTDQTPASATEELQSEELRHRIAQLEKKVASLSAKKARPRKTARK
ncbi:MAG TPA: polyhydroxyalkanoate synthesis regulator DNA-binding domain-containing protein [Acidobacteriaceae bacterium]|nr:polyhydroxyalkanoate synthesis regulator DNA-binding domain-containing protein [Acidobacteriaceae bacterium]